MKLVDANGNLQLQRALAHTYVKTIVEILYENLNQQDLLEEVTEVLQSCVRKDQPELQEKLQGILEAHEEYDENGNAIVANYISQVVNTLKGLYERSDETITDYRGAIVELLSYKLVSHRYANLGACGNSKRFIDEQGREITIKEVDVAAICDSRYLAEAYECKMRINKLEHDSCADLNAVFEASEARNYQSNVGVISFDNDRLVRRKLGLLDAPTCIKCYGIESIAQLEISPFQ